MFDPILVHSFYRPKGKTKWVTLAFAPARLSILVERANTHTEYEYRGVTDEGEVYDFALPEQPKLVPVKVA